MSTVKRKPTNRTVTAAKTESNQDANSVSNNEELENNTIDASIEALAEPAPEVVGAMPSTLPEDVQENNNKIVEDIKIENKQSAELADEFPQQSLPTLITLPSALEQAALVDAIVKLEINIAQLHVELGNYAADNKAATGIQHSVELAKQALSRAQRAYDSAAANNKDNYSKQLEQAKMDLVAVSTKHNVMVLRIKRALDILDVLDKHLIG